MPPGLAPEVASARAAEHAMVLAAHRGDAVAQRRLAALVDPVLLRVARALLAQRAVALDACDLAQHAWLEAIQNDWRVLLAYDPARASLRHFMAWVGRRAMLRLLHHRGRSGSCEQTLGDLPELLDEGGEQQLLARDELTKLVGALRQRLPARSWYCFEQAVLGDTSVPELMRTLSASRSSIDVRLSRVRTEARATRAALV